MWNGGEGTELEDENVRLGVALGMARTGDNDNLLTIKHIAIK